MKRQATQKDWLPLSKAQKAAEEIPTGEAFRVDCIDFEKGIRVGNLEPHERITRILKYGLETEYGADFITDRWGRGVYWQWICWVPRADREAKPVSNDVNFGCAKLYITVDHTHRIFQTGLQVERGEEPAKDYDWHRLMRQCVKGSALDRELGRCVTREGFIARVVGGSGAVSFDSRTWRSAAQVREAGRKAPKADWAAFQLFYPLSDTEVRGCSGLELVRAVMGVFGDVVPAMNECMQVRLERVRGSGIPSGKAKAQR